MEKKEERFRKDGVGGGSTSNAPYLDRSKVRILLCDNDPKSSKEALTLLCKCSYQVTSVKTPRQVIDALNAEGRDIDIILAEVDLPVSKGLKLLKYIMRDEDLRRIPIIMMSAQDDVSVVVRCLKLGAADYLVKPLRTNELLNLWTHMWRRRRMLGLPEKQILNYDFDLVASDPSDANTNSTTLFSDDTDDKSRRSTILENSISNNRENEPDASASTEPALKNSSQLHSDVLTFSEKIARFSSCPKKTKLRIGESSAFFTYVKSSIAPGQRISCIEKSIVQSEKSTQIEKHVTWGTSVDAEARIYTTKEVQEDYQFRNGFSTSDTIPDTNNDENLHSPVPSEFHGTTDSKEKHISTVLMHPRNQAQVNVSGLPPLTSFPYYVPGMMSQVMMPSPSLEGNQHDFQKHTASTILPQYNPHQQCSNHVPMMTSYPCYPICMQHVPTTQMWPSNGSSSYTQVKTDRIERREAALIKFRQKRKDRCFDKKIRYINRKRLAERRPRVRGQFVRQMNGVDVDLNGHPISVGDSDEGEEED